eukprot:jgi/Astpho2/3652/Aster-07854
MSTSGLGESEPAESAGLGSTGGLGLGLGGGESEEGDAKPTSRFTTFVKAAAPEVKPPDTDAEPPALHVDADQDFANVFSKFLKAEEMFAEEEPAQLKAEEGQVGQTAAADQDGDEEGSGDEADKVSKRKRKQEARLKVADLKTQCPRPEVVEVWDVTAQDPKLLVYLKSYRNSVPVPRHWSQKRKYLQGKRGIEKPPFQLPDFIEATGISEMRQAYQDKEQEKKLKQKQRERMQPKMGKLDIDYQVLHDAFFKNQTKPPLSQMGQLYYEGKEYEAHVKHAKPGVLSEGLRAALGMSDNDPPPWLTTMQRYGPPPSYPDLKIPGLNAPIPPGTQFGYQAGGWGKPPVDEAGEPLYGDVFGVYGEEDDGEQVDKVSHWGDIDSEEEESEEEEEDEPMGVEDAVPDDVASLDGMSSVATGVSSLPSGLETPEVLDLRKAKAGGEKHLYTVLEQQQAGIAAGNLMGSDHTYVMPDQAGISSSRPMPAGAARRLEQVRRQVGGDLEVALTPEELESMDEAALTALYQRRLAEEKSKTTREDFSDMVAQKAAQQKRKAATQKEAKGAKRQKETFKF